MGILVVFLGAQDVEAAQTLVHLRFLGRLTQFQVRQPQRLPLTRYLAYIISNRLINNRFPMYQLARILLDSIELHVGLALWIL